MLQAATAEAIFTCTVGCDVWNATGWRWQVPSHFPAKKIALEPDRYRFCVDYAGPAGERIDALIAKKRQEKLARRQGRKKQNPNWQSRLSTGSATWAARAERQLNPDVLATTLAGCDISDLFESQQDEDG
jgi:hypothetical protein